MILRQMKINWMKMQQMKIQKIQMQKMMTQQKMIHQKLQQTVHQVMAVRMLMVHSQVRINVQMLRT